MESSIVVVSAGAELVTDASTPAPLGAALAPIVVERLTEAFCAPHILAHKAVVSPQISGECSLVMIMITITEQVLVRNKTHQSSSIIYYQTYGTKREI